MQAWFGSSVHQVPAALQTLTTVLCDTAFAFRRRLSAGQPLSLAVRRLSVFNRLMLVSLALLNAYDDVAYGNSSSPIYNVWRFPLVGYQGQF